MLDGILKPLLHRVGVTVGAVLSTLGASSADVNLIVAAVPAVVGVVIDLTTRRVWPAPIK